MWTSRQNAKWIADDGNLRPAAGALRRLDVSFRVRQYKFVGATPADGLDDQGLRRGRSVTTTDLLLDVDDD